MTNPEPVPSPAETDTTLMRTAAATSATEPGGFSSREAGSVPSTVTTDPLPLSLSSSINDAVSAPAEPATRAMTAAPPASAPTLGPDLRRGCSKVSSGAGSAGEAEPAGDVASGEAGPGHGPGRDQPEPGDPCSRLMPG